MFEAWENELFDKYNGEARETEDDFWARMYEEHLPSRYWEPGCEESECDYEDFFKNAFEYDFVEDPELPFN